MLKSYKYRIFPNEEQREQLQKYFGVVRLTYNLALETKTQAYVKGKNLTKYNLIKQLPELKKEFDYIKECPSQCLQHSIINLDTAYKNFFKKNAKFPKFKNRYSKQSLHFPQGFRLDFENNKVILPKIKEIDVDFHRIFDGEVRNITLTKTTTNKYYISVLVDNKKEKPLKKKVKLSTAVGCDFGIKDLCITSDGEVFENKRFFKKAQKQLRKEQRKLSRCKKGSKNREKQRLKVALLHEKIRNQRTDYLQKLSTYLIQNYDTVCIEDLAVSNMVKNRKLSKAISEMGWGKLRAMLEYKAEWYGKNVRIIGRFEPSSKICSDCGSIKKDLKLSDRMYNCGGCGTNIDRDLNASYNILNFGLRDKASDAKAVH